MQRYEKKARSNGFHFIIGLDEAGRGPLAGPVVASAVCLTSFKFKNPVRDSKQMTPELREQAFHEILEKATVGIGVVSETVIDQINVLNASLMAMEIAVGQLLRYMPGEVTSHEAFPSQVFLLIDGNYFKSALPYAYRTVVGGDDRSLSIAAASIVAKVYRDRIMEHQYDRLFPQYGFKQHKGYATDVHREALKTHGPCRLHRKSFTLL